MRKIAITGGKGGVGKSTFSVLLASKLAKEGSGVVLCDADVECPNDYLLLGQKLGSTVKKTYALFPKLNEEKCQKCGLCVEKCRSKAVFQLPGQYPQFIKELCSGCGLCWNLCPHGAIEVEKDVIGEIFVNKCKMRNAKCKIEIQDSKLLESVGGQRSDKSSRAGQLWLVTGRSVGVVDETGPIVGELRQFAERFAFEHQADYLLVDSAPGLHCSVIRALIDMDLAYAVTEPTPLGAHDLELILKLLRELGVPAKVVLNQADLGNRDRVDALVRDFGVKIGYEIPYSKELVEAYSCGKLGNFDFV